MSILHVGFGKLPYLHHNIGTAQQPSIGFDKIISFWTSDFLYWFILDHDTPGHVLKCGFVVNLVQWQGNVVLPNNVSLVTSETNMADNNSAASGGGGYSSRRQINDWVIIVQVLIAVFLYINILVIVTFFRRDFFPAQTCATSSSLIRCLLTVCSWYWQTSC